MLSSDGPQSRTGLSCRYDSVLIRNLLPKGNDFLL